MDSHTLNIRTSLTGAATAQLSQHFGPAVGNAAFRQHPAIGRKAASPAPAALQAVFKAMAAKTPNGLLEDPKSLKGTIYSPRNRGIITKWIRDVCDAFGLRMTTFVLAVNLTDAFLVAHLTAAVNQCQLAAIGGIWLAAKFEELDDKVPLVQSLVDVCDKAYSAPEIIDIEDQMLRHYGWRLPHTTAANYVYLYLHALVVLAASSGANWLDAGYDVLRPQPRVASGLYLGGMTPTGCSVALLTAAASAADVLTPRYDPNHQVWVSHLDGNATLGQSSPQFCGALGYPRNTMLKFFAVSGVDIVVGTPIRADVTLEQVCAIAVASGALAPLLYAVPMSDRTCIFAESNQTVLLKGPNQRLMRLTDHVLSEAAQLTDYIRFSPQATGLIALVAAAAASFQSSAAVSQLNAFLTSTFSVKGRNSLSMARGICERLATGPHREILHADMSARLDALGGAAEPAKPTTAVAP